MVRPAVPNDGAAIARVHVATWRSAYRGLLSDAFLDSLSEPAYADRWRRSVADPGLHAYVAEADGSVVGFASGGRERAGEPGFGGELYALYVLEEAQRHGHGRELVRAIVDRLRDMGLTDMVIWVLRDNARARRFYEKLGGVYVREQPITIGSELLQEVAYGWRSLDDVTY
jgi:ribosomal protein S18 acetylase RimI-like enzyme